jgi:hypothetical protein
VRRPVLTLLGSLVVGACAAQAALAAPIDDARAVADTFMSAAVKSDAQTACALLSDRLLAKIGGLDRCKRALTEQSDVTTTTFEPIGLGDDMAYSVLLTTFNDARAMAVGGGGYVNRNTSLTMLVGRLRTLEPDFTFSVGSSAAAARDTPPTHVVIDRRTTAKQLMLYAESDSGTIFRLSATGTKHAHIAKVAVGVPKQPAPPTVQPPRPPPPTYAISGANGLDDGSVLVDVALQYENTTIGLVLQMRLQDAAWKVDDVLVSVEGSAVPVSP